MSSSLLDRLRKEDKRGLFSPTQVSVNYPTGFLPLDYRNGYVVNVINDKEEIVDRYNSIGIGGGTFNTVVGKSGVAKTTWTIQTAYNIVKNYGPDAFVLVYDLEQSLQYTRIKDITKAPQEGLENKIVLRQERNYIEDIFDSIVLICKDKEANKNTMKYDTGLLDEFGKPIKVYIPTVVIIDSLPLLSSKNDEDEMTSTTAVTRRTQVIKQFYTKLMPLIKTYNITVFVINHENQVVNINPFQRTSAQVNYFGADKSMSGGVAAIYLANNIFEFVASTKFKEDTDGFDGFLVRVTMVKSRSNKAGQSVNLVYNQSIGFDPILSLYKFAEENDLVEGRNPYRYFSGHPETKFDSRKFREAFHANEEVQNALREVTLPELEKMLSNVDSE